MALTADTTALRDALVILGAAGIVIPAFARFRITPIIGFILIGVLVGPYGLVRLSDALPWITAFTITNKQVIEPFAEFGIVLLLFSIGLELSFARLKSMRRLVFGVGAAQLFGAGLLIALALIAFGQDSRAAFGLGIALALSSTALVIPITGTSGAVGRNAFGMLLFEDLALVPIVFLLGSLAGASAGLANFSQILLTGGATLVVMMLVGRFGLPRLFAQAARTKSPELFLSATLLVVILSSLMTLWAGLSALLGALIAGLLIAETAYRSEVESVVLPFRGLALGIFLITVGMSLDLTRLMHDWPMILLALTGVVVIKFGVTAGLLRLNGVRKGVAAEVGVLMGSPSETTLIVLGAAAQIAIIDPQTAGFWQVVTALGLTITPLLAKLGRLAAARIEGGRTGAPQEDQPIPPEGRTIIIGFGRVGRMVAAMLDVHNQPWVAAEGDIDTVTRARREGKPVQFLDARRRQALEQLGLDRARAVVMTMDDHVQAAALIRQLRADYPDLTIVARARDTSHAAELYRAGASDAVPETLESSLQLSEAVLVDLGVAMGPVIASVHQMREDLRTAIRHRAELQNAPRLGALKRPAKPSN
ncbi:MAG: sodium:proton exchanger [Sphingomonadaceae bacterium]|nr:sodium:proton exchanger [Sphingomonadaceae bacterium]NBU78138.1 sodium:proton exchanger [Sphingomonadaceae bacterium]